MVEETGGTAAQGVAEAQAQGADSEAQGATPDAQGATAEQAGGSAVIVETLTRKIAELERDNRGYRQREKAQTDAARAKEDAERSEVEKLSAKVAELESALAEKTRREQEQSLRMASVTAASKLGFRNPDLAYRLIDPGAIEWADDGTPKGIEKMLSDVAKSDPYLVTATDFGGGSRGTSPASAGSDDMNALLRGAAHAKGR
jgi:hypothetical protein